MVNLSVMEQPEIKDIVVDKQRLKLWIKSYIRDSWWRIIALLFVSFMSVGIGLLVPWPLKLLSDSVFGNVTAPGVLAPFSQTAVLLYIVAGIYIAIYVLQSALSLVGSYIGARFGFRMNINVKKQLFFNILKMPLSSPKRLDTGDYVYRQNQESNAISNLILGDLVSIFESFLTLFGVLFILILIDWKLTLISISVIPFMGLSMLYFGSKIEQSAKELAEISSRIYTLTQESIMNADIVQMFNRQNYQTETLVNVLFIELKKRLKYTVMIGMFGLVSSMFVVMAIISIVIFGGIQVLDGVTTFGSLLIFITYSGYLFDPLEEIAGAIGNVRQDMASVKRVFQVIDDTNGLEETSGGKQLKESKGKIEIRNVNFSYGDRQILKNVSLVINPGEKIGFLGPSGSGKSTLLSLLMRFSVPQTGEIYMDDNKYSELSLASLREQIAVVEQQPKLFSSTVSENIAFNNPELKNNHAEVASAAKAAYADDFIDQLPAKYDELINGTGVNLSGGQKQRISIARAIFKDAPVLVLDEPTSAQDVNSENKVLEAINKLMKNKTVLMVTHKHSLLSQMDRVFVLENNKVLDVKIYGGLDAYTRYLQVHRD
jgi:ATP-binding cassette subfamily B protein